MAFWGQKKTLLKSTTENKSRFDKNRAILKGSCKTSGSLGISWLITSIAYHNGYIYHLGGVLRTPECDKAIQRVFVADGPEKASETFEVVAQHSKILFR